MYKSFREMPVWQEALDLSLKVYQITIDLPRSEDYGLTSQLRRASNSVSANISEGFGRKTAKDKASFYTNARGSAFETQHHLIYGNKIGYFSEEATNSIIEQYNILIFSLNKIIATLNNS